MENNEISSIKYIIFGGLIGFIIFLINVLSMNGILFRPNSMNEKVFTIIPLIEYFKVPIKIKSINFYILWGLEHKLSILTRLKMVNLNWIFMTSLGAIIGFIISKII